MKEKVEEGGGRVLLGDNTGEMMVMQLSARFQCVGVWISNGLPSINENIGPLKNSPYNRPQSPRGGVDVYPHSFCNLYAR